MRTPPLATYFVATALTFAAFASGAEAQLLVYEGFTYGSTNALLTTASGGAWTTSSTDNDAQYISSGLTYGSLQVSGGAARTTTAWGSSARLLTYDLGGAGNLDISSYNEIWLSMLVQTPGAVSNGSESAFGMRMQRNSWSSFQNYTAGKGWNNQTANVTSFGGDISGADYSTLGTNTFLLVYRFTVGQVGELFLNPTIGGAAPVAGTGQLLTDTNGNLTAIESLALSFRGHDKIYDELRIGTTFASVTPVPEPSSLALIVLGAINLLARRRG